MILSDASNLIIFFFQMITVRFRKQKEQREIESERVRECVYVCDREIECV